jgi:Niemann-Pick C1 protein
MILTISLLHLQLGISLLAVFVVTYFMLGLDMVSAVISLIVIVMILINLGGMMYW